MIIRDNVLLKCIGCISYLFDILYYNTYIIYTLYFILLCKRPTINHLMIPSMYIIYIFTAKIKLD